MEIFKWHCHWSLSTVNRAHCEVNIHQPAPRCGMSHATVAVRPSPATGPDAPFPPRGMPCLSPLQLCPLRPTGAPRASRYPFSPPWLGSVPLLPAPGLPQLSAPPSLHQTVKVRDPQALSVSLPLGRGQNVGPRFLVTCGKDECIHGC